MSHLCLLQTGFLMLALSLFSAVASASDAEIVSFEAELLPILKARCAVCHMTGQEPGGMALTPDKAWSALVAQRAVGVENMLRVAPGDPQASYLLHKLWGSHRSVGGAGSRMPMHQPALKTAALLQFEQWVMAGAPNN